MDNNLRALLALVVLLTSSLVRPSQSKPTGAGSPASEPTATANLDQSSLSGLGQSDPVRTIHYHFDQKMEPFLQLHKFNSTAAQDAGSSTTTSGNNATCNDGSPAGYYKRLNNHSKSWIIYLQGGGYCGSEETCQHRWRHSAHLMSSNYWPNSISVDGILSSEPKDNPYLWNANHIYVPYCSSDSWTGLQEARGGQSSFAFMGSKIIERVLASLFDDLPRESSLFEAKFVLLAGDSAGATGVILNLDKVNRIVQGRLRVGFNSNSNSNSDFNQQQPPAPNCGPLDGAQQLCEQQRQVPVIRGLADSGWFLDNEPYDLYQHFQQHQHQQPPPSASLIEPQQQANEPAPVQPVDCDRQRCSPLQSIKQAMLHWNGQVPTSCALRHPSEPWRCYFGYRAYPVLRTPLFVVQWLYDEAQLMVDNIVRPGTLSQWNYVNRLASEMRASLDNVSALFAPSCFSHSLIVKQNWNQININGFKLPHILNSWEEETLASQPSLELLVQDHLQFSEQVQSLMMNSNQVAIDRTQVAGSRPLAPSYYQLHHHQLEMRSAVQPGRTIAAGQRSRSRKKKRNNQGGHANSRLASSNQQQQQQTTNRLSRSTSAVVEESTQVFSNSVPEIFLISNQQTNANSRHQETGANKFRLIDTCGWPQCNRDCPQLDLEFNVRPMLPY